jgi:hypothetical protein
LSTLGKVVTVLMVIASLAVCATVVAMAKLQPDWHSVAMSGVKSLQDAAEQNRVLQSAVGNANAELTLSRRVLNQKIDNQTQAIADLTTSKTGLEKDLTTEKANAAVFATKLANIDTNLANLNTEKKKAEETRDAAIADATQLREANQKLRADWQNSSRQVSDLQRTNRDLEVRVNDLSTKVNYVKQTGGALPAEVQALPSVDLSGIINNADAQRNLAEINLGSRDKVVTGTQFTVSRDNKYLADLVIEKVDENSSVGRLQTVQGEIRKGDYVTYTVKR